MLKSILERKRQKITLDKVLITQNNKVSLELDPDIIDKEIVNHFQNVAGKKFCNPQINDYW
jgi:hypothetical protein